MTATLLGSDAVGFADGGGGGHVYSFPLGAPGVGEVDVLHVNSNVTVSTPSGFTLPPGGDATNSQGAYIFYRKAVGGEGSSVTVVTNGNQNTTLTWSRWSSVDAFSVANFQRIDGSAGTSLPATTTGALAATDMLLIAFAALHNFGAAVPTTPVWTNSFTSLQAVSQGGAASAASVAGFTGYKTNAGTASETINSVTWTNNAADRYAMWIAFTTLSVTGTAVTGALDANLPGLEADLDGDITVTGSAVITLPTLSVAATGRVVADGELTVMLPTLTAAVTGSVDVDGQLNVTLPTLSAAVTGDVVLDGSLGITLPMLSVAATGFVDSVGDLDAVLPPLEVDLAGETIAPPVIDIFSQAFAIVTGIGECTVAELDRTEWGAPDRICLAVPGDIAWDDCQCGQFAQSITTEVPSENFPLPATDRRSTACGPAFLVVTVVASIARCVPGIDRSNKPPSCDTLLVAARRLEDDRTALRIGVTCCLRELRRTYRITDYAVGAATTQGPEGSCVGVELTYQFAVSNVCC